MNQSPTRPKKSLFGMNRAQVTVLIFMGLMTAVIVIITCFLVFGNSPTNNWLSRLGFINPSKAIVGKWELSSDPIPSQPIGFPFGCDFGYPQTIEFFSDGTYVGMAITLMSDLFVWQGGQYELLDDGRIKMQTKGGYAVYGFSIDAENIGFVDDNNCEIHYQRVSLSSYTATGNEGSVVFTETILPSPTLTSTPTLEPSPSSTTAPSSTPLPQEYTPTRTRAPTWTAIP